jgi:hypothetical protein
MALSVQGLDLLVPRRNAPGYVREMFLERLRLPLVTLRSVIGMLRGVHVGAQLACNHLELVTVSVRYRLLPRRRGILRANETTGCLGRFHCPA